MLKVRAAKTSTVPVSPAQLCAPQRHAHGGGEPRYQLSSSTGACRVKIRSEKLRQLRQNNFPVVIQNDKESFFSLSFLHIFMVVNFYSFSEVSTSDRVQWQNNTRICYKKNCFNYFLNISKLLQVLNHLKYSSTNHRENPSPYTKN